MTKFASLKKKVEKLSKNARASARIQQLSDAELELLLKGLIMLQSGVALTSELAAEITALAARAGFIPCREC